jgi:DGQHR domain-containing protein
VTSIEKIHFRCLEVEQPIGTFYIGAIHSDDLLAISYADVRRIEERDIEKYLGIQRTLSTPRVAELQKYVHTVDATFPTAVILALGSEHAEYNDKLMAMTITRDERVAKIIDGQHRIAGLKGYTGPRFMLNVAIFIDMDIEDQATVFATINLSQTKVNKSLVYDLYDYARSRSPQKTAHHIARVLNREDASPFVGKIKILGRATPGKDETLTQAAFVEALLPFITSDPISDRDALKRGSSLHRIHSVPSEPRFLRNMFIDEKDDDIALLIWNYFAAVQERWPYAWSVKEQGNILNRTTGFTALMRFLPTAYWTFARAEDVVHQEDFAQIFATVNMRDDEFTPANFPPGSSGVSALLRKLVSETESVRQQIAGRMPVGLSTR